MRQAPTLNMYLKLKDLLDRFNVGNAVLYLLLLLLSVLVSLRVEGIITWSYGAVFLPLWLWNVLVAAGAVIGIVVWVRKKRLRQDPEHVHHLKALILSPCLQFPLFLTELLVAINLDTGDHFWRAIFTLLYILPAFYMVPCIWGCFRRRNIDLEILGMVSLLQVIFLGIRLDRVVEWKWAVVFIPSYLLLLAFWGGLGVYTVYLLLQHCLLTTQDLQASRLADLLKVISSTGFGVCVTIFMTLLTSQLDGRISAPYPAIFIPLFLAILLLLVTTVTRKPANPWWFGIHKTFSTFLLDACPMLREYVNISIVPEDTSSQTSNLEMGSQVTHKPNIEPSPSVPNDVYLYEDIHTPD